MNRSLLSSRATMWAIVLAAGAIFAASAWALAGRIVEFNRTSHLVRYHAEILDRRAFQIGSYPEALLADAADAAGNPVLRLDYAGKTTLIPVKKPSLPNLPTLAAYEEWAKVLALNEVELDASGHSAAKPGTERLLIVVRRTPEGFDPETWGSVRRVEWVFDFYELKPDGSVTASARRWPRPDLREESFQKQAAESGDQRLKALAAVPPLEERSIEYFAAMHVIPKLNVPQHKFNDTALNWRVLGWTLPVSMLSGLVLVPALFFAVAPRRKT